jgi:beta-ketoacyl-acyl-carrier-protein synthase II
MAERRRVVVTGLGVVSSSGLNVPSLWENIQAGRSGIRRLKNIPTDELTCTIGGEMDFEPADYLDKKEAKRMDRFTQFAMVAAKQAYADAKLEGHIDKTRLGVVIGSGAGGLTTVQHQLVSCFQKGFQKCSPFLVPMMITDMAAGRVSIELGAQGPNLAIVTACATSTDCIGQAARMIEYGELDAAVAGGAEAPLVSVSVAGFAAMRALSMSAEKDPETSSRPFDKDRDGFVMSEGGAILILEERDHALKRGATIYGEIVGYGRSSDAYDIVMPHSQGEGAARAMASALRNANLAPEAIGYINAHGTSTPLGDVAETIAIKKIFPHAAEGGLPVSSTKSMHGHMLGATGALEAIITLLALRDQVLPPTINLDEAGEGCDLDYVPHTARKVEGVTYGMSNSFGFGGHNATLILKKAD